MSLASLALVGLLSLLVGTLMGLLGGGGGFLYVLILIVVLDVPAHAAVGTGVATAAAGAAVSLFGHHRGGTVDWSRAPGFLLAGAVGATGATMVTAVVPQRPLIALIVVAYGVVGVLPYRLLGRIAESGSPADPRRLRAGRALVGGLAGVTVGAFAVNGGPMIGAYLTGYERVEPARAVGTAVAVLFPLSVIGAVAHLGGGTVALEHVLALAPGAAAGGYLGSRLARVVRAQLLAPLLGLLTLGTMIPLLFR